MIPIRFKFCFSSHSRPLSILLWNARTHPQLQYRNFSTDRKVRIGSVEIPLRRNIDHNDHRLVPSKYLLRENLDADEAKGMLSSGSPSILRHLQWMMAKDSMHQDMLLVGPPGAGEVFRRRLALAYAELTEKPIEILSISGDLTESDLKQRREIVQNDSNATEIQFVDQAPVRAAKYGRLLLLDGIEKAERNVLPSLNNLLENREMHLEDGTMLLPSHRLEQLSSSSSSSFLTPVHPDFRVIALGVPSPPFPGKSLDPPLRSRFQIRRIDNPSSEQLYEQLLEHVSSHDQQDQIDLAKSCAIFAGAMEKNGEQFPSNRLNSVWKIINKFPLEDSTNIMRRAFPVVGNDEVDKDKKFQEFEDLFGWNMNNFNTNEELSRYVVKSVEPSSGDTPCAKISFLSDVDPHREESPSVYSTTGNRPINVNPSPNTVHTPSFWKAITAMIQEHSVGNDFVLVSPKGEGKTTLTREFASLLGYETHLYAMNSEMTSQHLLQRRSTDPTTGETIWDDSPLLRAAHQGDICVLDGIEKLRPDVLSSIQSLIVDRDIQLPDGRRALRNDRIVNDDESTIEVHPSFRVIALASLPRGDDGSRWITPNLMAMFSTIRLPPLQEECLRKVLRQFASCDQSFSAVDTILQLREQISESVAEECGISPLSTRNMVRAVRRMGSQNNLHHVLSSIFLLDLLPPRQRNALQEIFNQNGIFESPKNDFGETKSEKIRIDEKKVTIGSMVLERGSVNRPEMIPSPQAFDIPAHTEIIKELLRDWNSGERSFLLLGNQGVGKNKIVDRICEIANWEREYIQLHRDSTIGQLTLTPQLEDGKIVWNDSPLIRAVRDGCVLLVDEADKAPVEVVSVLKGLVEDGELLLADGRRISRHGDGSDSDTIPIHPNFSLWVLANRPGFPFLGNDFFREIGDCFDTRVVNNPDLDSEIQLLSSYAPSLDTKVIRALASSFSELRELSNNGDLTYPYSTREAIAVVKHIEKFPQDGLDVALHNIVDFDSYDTDTYLMLGEAFERNGIAISDSLTWKEELLQYKSERNGDSNHLSIEYFDSNRGDDGESHTPPEHSSPKFGKWDDNNEIHVGGNQWAGGTGGSDTAGLGGRGGPYRLDRGHKVHQVSDEAKAEVSEEAKRAARQMAQNALDEKLRQIGMGQEDYDRYKNFSANIQKDVAKLRSILKSVESRTNERGWLRRQSYGEIDDSKIVDGITGDKYIYKRRGSVEETTFPKEKYIRFVMDVSGSMYRFNGYDQRLIRCLEAALLVMESFPSRHNLGESKKFDYSMVGHSGDSPSIPFVDWASPPKHEKDRLQLLQTMLAHSQYCMSGDYTLEAMRQAIDEVARKVGDIDNSSNTKSNGTVICLSDANLARYGIDPRRIGEIIEHGAKKGVKAYIVFIASFGEEAKAIARALPAGSGYICMETSELPKAVREILSSGVLK